MRITGKARRHLAIANQQTQVCNEPIRIQGQREKKRARKSSFKWFGLAPKVPKL